MIASNDTFQAVVTLTESLGQRSKFLNMVELDFLKNYLTDMSLLLSPSLSVN